MTQSCQTAQFVWSVGPLSEGILEGMLWVGELVLNKGRAWVEIHLDQRSSHIS